MKSNTSEIIVFTLYLIFMISIGVYFFLKNKSGGDKTYFLGGRKMGAWVSALSAGASDMSAWVLMGLPASVYALGMGQVWIAIGLAVGYALSWIYEAPRLRSFSIECNDSITIPQYLTNRFLSKSMALQIICAVIFIFAYTIYAASSIKACGTLFNTVIGIDAKVAMYIAAAIIISYTFLGGFSAVCWTDFFQGMLMLDRLLPGNAYAGRPPYSTAVCNIHAPGSGCCCSSSRKLLEPGCKLAGHHLRPCLGSWLLRNASHHHQVHGCGVSGFPQEICKDRYHMDNPYPYLRRNCRTCRTYTPGLR